MLCPLLALYGILIPRSGYSLMVIKFCRNKTQKKKVNQGMDKYDIIIKEKPIWKAKGFEFQIMRKVQNIIVLIII